MAEHLQPLPDELPLSPPSPRLALEQLLQSAGPLAVAVSGGVDSLTLAVLAHRVTADALMVHATSPAVPPEATARVRDRAAQEGWRLEVVDAGEFDDPDYRANPVNRCFYCKTNLYGAVRRISPRQIVSGANLDDLAEYRPGLDAAREHAVRHPYVEAGVTKAAVRRLAAELGLGSIADLPSSPCLSSRVETGIAIDPQALANIHAVERLVGEALAPRTVRCRLRAEGIVVELDGETLEALLVAGTDLMADRIRGAWVDAVERPIRFARYRTGSAFLTKTLQPLQAFR